MLCLIVFLKRCELNSINFELLINRFWETSCVLSSLYDSIKSWTQFSDFELPANSLCFPPSLSPPVRAAPADTPHSLSTHLSGSRSISEGLGALSSSADCCHWSSSPPGSLSFCSLTFCSTPLEFHFLSVISTHFTPLIISHHLILSASVSHWKPDTYISLKISGLISWHALY